MHSTTIIWPVLAQIFLTLVVFVVLAARKGKAVKAGEVDRQQAALNNQAWPDDVVKVSNNIANQFQVPVLFYVLCLVLHCLDAVNTVAVALAWLFALSRFIHAYVHIGSNYVPVRLRVFLIGVLAVMALFALAVWRLATL